MLTGGKDEEGEIHYYIVAADCSGRNFYATALVQNM